ncbi:ubiquitin-protein ligase, putative [Ricinus communis]|uniref:Ubiquitin-protein ligase, putative n=1 Tax=Ricinus communis TaxID=3988 RepID=B9RWC6_RICCO|nr:ubiquitin-protein ligase, putative [Ricinus communis]|eukprot:XP_002518045.1 F-box/kelch-repeat protein At3g23880 [Ricinus communis]
MAVQKEKQEGKQGNTNPQKLNSFLSLRGVAGRTQRLRTKSSAQAEPDTSISTLPEDLIVEILSRVPVKPLLRFKCVSKSWNSIISDPRFAKLQLKRAKENSNISCNRLLLSTWSPRSLDFEAFCDDDLSNTITNVSFPAIVKGPPTFYVRILGSCDGLVCLLDDYGTMFLWNPTTRQYKELPKPKGAVYRMFLHGIGYNFSTDDYGVVFASRFTDDGNEETTVELYTLKNNTWRKIEDVDSTPEPSGRSGIFWNGGLYWLKVKGSDCEKVYIIVSFDMVEKKFKEVLSLPRHFDPSRYKANLGMSGNSLCVFCECKGSCFETFVLNINGTETFWTKLFSFPHDRFPGFDNAVLCTTKNGEVVLECDGWKLYLYNPKEGTFRNFEMNNGGDVCELELYIESLVSPNV